MTDAAQSRWVGKDEHGGVPSLVRPDKPISTHWNLGAIAAVGRPHDPVVSPDGQFVSVVFDRDTSDIWIVPLSAGPPYQLTTGREPAAYWEDDPATWSPDGQRIAYTADGSVWVVPVVGGLPTKIGAGSSPVWISNSEILLIADRDGESRLARTTVDDPWPVGVTEPGQNVAGVSVSTTHGVVLYVNYRKDDLQNSEIWAHDLETGESEQLTDEPGMHDQGPRLSPDGSTVAFTSERSGWNEIYLVSSDGTSLRRATSDEADFSSLDWSLDGGYLVATRTKHGVCDLVTVAVDSGQVELLAQGGEWAGSQWATGGIVGIQESHAMPPRLVQVSTEGTIRTLLDSVPASIRVAPCVPYEDVRYSSLDGMDIHGFLFRPSGADRAPVVVYPHGGPTSAYTDAWDGHAQYFVDKGYGWFAINFRGSTGYGRNFERANHGEWGVADTDDCLAAADYLRTLDWVDPARLAIFGASYGSYMALASLARDPEYRFACGVAKYGDSDIATSWAQGDRGGREDLERMMGRPADNPQAYRDGSPLSIVGQIARPILVAHGEQDDRVHPDQSVQLVDELRRLDKTFEYVTYPTEGHGLLRASPQIHFYERLERFLDWYLM